jgi:hypothetical protein
MVTDQARNHIGDTYWKESHELQEGDEFSLDKGVLVEVAEAMGITQTDLASVLAKKKDPPKDAPPPRPTPSISTRPFQRPTSVAPSNVARGASQLRHRSLNTLLGTPKGPVGKAMPMQSPYEARMEKEKENELAEDRAPKRQKTAQRPTGWRASSPVHGDESSPVRPMPGWTRIADAKNVRMPQPALSRPAKVITISSESDHPVVSSGVTLPGTPAKVVRAVATAPVISAPAIPSSVFAEPVTVPIEAPEASRPKIRLPKKKPVETPKRPAPNSSPPVSASNRLMNVDFAVQPVQKPQKKPSPPPSPPLNPKGKALRLSTGVKRGTLLCQTMSRPASRAGSEPRSSASRLNNAKTSRIRNKEPTPSISEEYSKDRRDYDLLPSKPLPPSNAIGQPLQARREATVHKAKSRTPTPAPQDEDVFDDPELIHGLMDQQLLMPSSPIKQPTAQPSPARKAPVAKPIIKKLVKEKSKVRTLEPTEIEALDQESLEIVPPASKRKTKKTRVVKKAIPEPQVVRPASPPIQPVPKPPEIRSRGISPAHTDISEIRSRTNSISPAKKPLSTGGFPKRAKRVAREVAAATSTVEAVAPPPPPAPPREAEAVPPHPLRSGTKELLMSTTELAALLTKPKKRTRAEDPIEDDGQPAGRLPARKIRRVRSENDAPIPSTAEDWEKRNLPKTSSDLTEVDDTPAAAPAVKRKASGLAALVKRTDPRKKFQRTQSLNVETSVVVEEPDLPSPVIDKDVGPWSTEAFDLFDWRPPVREEAVT